MSDVEHRGALRKKVHFSVLCRTGVKQGQATLVDISLTGAQLESSAILPPPGMLVTIRVAQPEQEEPIALIGRAVRRTPRGFAMQFLSVTDELRKLIADLD